MISLQPAGKADAGPAHALSRSTIAFTVCFAVWTIFSIIGVRLKDELSLSETEFGLLVGMSAWIHLAIRRMERREAKLQPA